MQKTSLYAIKELFAALPPIFKLLVIFTIVAVLVAGIRSTQLVTFHNTGIVKSIDIGVYWDVNCSSPVEGIDWDIIEPGENKTLEFYVRNEGNSELVLSIWAVNWSSLEVEHYINFTNDYQGQPIGVSDTTPISLILSLSQNVKDISTFSFDVVIETREGS